MIRRAAGGLLLAAWLAACGSTPPPPSLPSTASPPPPHLALKATGNAGEPLPPAHFDPAALPAFYYFTEDGQVGVWSGPIGRPDLASPLVDPISEAEGSFGTATRFPDGSVVVPFESRLDNDSKLLLLRPGADPRVLLDRTGSTVGVAPEAAALIAPRTTQFDDDGIWQVWLDGREPMLVLPPALRPELVARAGLALGSDGQRIAAATCANGMQLRWPGEDPVRVQLGVPVGFDRSGDLIAYGDCAGFRIVRVASGETSGEDLLPQGGYEAIMSPDRRTLVALDEDEVGRPLTIVDLDTGDRRNGPLATGGWDFTSDTTDRYVVLRRDAGAGVMYRFIWAIHDLVEGWTGYFVVDTYPPAP